jgi:putative spermidine/putrescine transport system permease protein
MDSMIDTAMTRPSAAHAHARLQRDLGIAKLKRRTTAGLLVAPLALFLLCVFVVPIGALLVRAVQNPEVAAALPGTIGALRNWHSRTLPDDAAYAALANDLSAADAPDAAGALARRLNNEIPGFRSLVMKTVRAMPLRDDDGRPLAANRIRTTLTELDGRWADVRYWQAIARNGHAYSPFYVLAALDFRQDAAGRIRPSDPDQRIYQSVFARTFLIATVVTALCLALGYPLAYWIATLPARQANLAMILVLIPFWTSILVRVAAWIVILQSEGLLNRTLGGLGLIHAPLPLLFNRAGVYISMTHIMLPFMILPLYSVMKTVPSSYQRAAISLGSHPFAAFWRVYVPQTYAGIGAGSLLVFIVTLGYYITPALLGGPGDQMISYYVAYFTNVSINWGMACALGGLLLVATLLLYAAYGRFARVPLSIR